jgi:hypothetical protein
VGSLARAVRRHTEGRNYKAYQAARRAVERCKPISRLTGCLMKLIERDQDKALNPPAPRVEITKLFGATRDVKAEVVESDSTVTRVWEDRLVAAAKKLVERATGEAHDR